MTTSTNTSAGTGVSVTDRLGLLWRAYISPGDLQHVRTLWAEIRPCIPPEAADYTHGVDFLLKEANPRSNIDRRVILEKVTHLSIWMEGWEASAKAHLSQLPPGGE
jgi:hypothetical protein